MHFIERGGSNLVALSLLSRKVCISEFGEDAWQSRLRSGDMSEKSVKRIKLNEVAKVCFKEFGEAQ